MKVRHTRDSVSLLYFEVLPPQVSCKSRMMGVDACLLGCDGCFC